jgi:hypothetical protein
MHARYEREHGSDGAHRLFNHAGREDTGPNLSPRFDNGRKAMRLPCERHKKRNVKAWQIQDNGWCDKNICAEKRVPISGFASWAEQMPQAPGPLPERREPRLGGRG